MVCAAFECGAMVGRIRSAIQHRKQLLRFGLLLFGGIAAVLIAAWPLSSAQAYEQPPGKFSIGLQGGAGALSGDGAYEFRDIQYHYQNHDWGGALGIRLRYGLDATHAIGVSFEDQRFGRKPDADPVRAPRQFQVVNHLVDYYLYFNRREKICPYLVLGAGGHRDTFRFGGSDNVIPPWGFVANFGGGVEYFVLREFSADLTLRGYYLQSSGGRSLAAAVMLGFQYYLLR